MPNRKIVTWQPVLTDHQSFTFQALGRQSGSKVVAYVTALEDPTRRAQGWTDTKVKSVERCKIPNRGGLWYFARQLITHRQDIHIFASAFQQPIFMAGLLIAQCLGVKYYLLSEPYSPISHGYLREVTPLIGRLKAVARPLLYRLYAKLFLRKVAGIFCISELAMTQYKRAGVAGERLFPFGYFVPCTSDLPNLTRTETASPGKALRLIFVGSLLKRKGLDLLISAVTSLREKGLEVTLDAFGPGDPAAFKFDNKAIIYRGLIPFGRAQEVIATYDLLVLPSRYDGWGVVVNEALCAGVPVVCSKQCGSSVIVSTFGAGTVFDAGDPDALEAALSALHARPTTRQSMRTGAARAAQALQPDVAADYMNAVLNAGTGGSPPPPASPWYRGHA